MATIGGPDSLLRSCIRHGNEPKQDIEANCLRLVNALQNGEYALLNPDCNRIGHYVREYLAEYKEPPTYEIIRDHFERSDEINVVDKLHDLSSLSFHGINAFKEYLKAEVDDQRRAKAIHVLDGGRVIVEKGLFPKPDSKGKPLKGPEDALAYVTAGLVDLLNVDDAKSRAKLWAESHVVLDDYRAAKAAMGKLGLKCGLFPIDNCFGGIRRGELWTHAAFTGQLKSTLAANITYHATMFEERNVLYVSLEMTQEQLRRCYYVLHSAQDKWKRPGLNYTQVREGILSPLDEEYLTAVANDATATATGEIQIWTPPKKVMVDDIMLYAERIHRNCPLGLIVIDHSGLVQPSSKDRNYFVAMNSVFTDAKRGALSFDGGAGVPVLVLHQINREGFKAAAKDGKLTLAHLSNTNEAERSSDYITTSYVDDDLRGRSLTRISCLKNREGGPFSPFEASVSFPSRRIFLTGQEDGNTSSFSEEEYRTLMEAV
jgi:hypothetical protein